jgi:hypothetical protein
LLPPRTGRGTGSARSRQRSKGAPPRAESGLMPRPGARQTPRRIPTLRNAMIRREAVQAAPVPRLSLQQSEPTASLSTWG